MLSDEIVVCTIIAKNYLSHARVFTDSFLKANPAGKVFVLLVDEIDNHFDPNKEKFSLVDVKEIGIKNLESFCFKYNILEQNTAVKASFLKYLFSKYNLKKLAYFDPDIFFINNITNLWKILDKKSIVLTPHITSPILDNKNPSEYDIIRAGSYNLGFIALANNQTTLKFLDWWIPHLMQHAFSDVDKGLFTDQKWIDLVPSIFDDVYIIRHPGYNVGYWNLMHRNIEIIDGKINVNGKPMYFFHFSGFEPENMEKVSKHQNRFTLSDIKSAKPLFELYRDLLIEYEYLDIKKWKCKFNFFDNGIKIPSQARKIYNETLEKGLEFDNPFATANSRSFLKFLNESVDEKFPLITRLWYKIYKERQDLQIHFPDPLQRDREEFLKWIGNTLKIEYEYDDFFLPSNILEYPKRLGKTQDSRESREKEFIKKRPVNKPEFSNLGINIAGYFKGEFGVAEAARSYTLAIKNAGIPVVLNNITAQAHRNEDKTFQQFDTKNPHYVNLVIVNADQSDVFYHEVGPNYFDGKYNIAIWSWELSNFPEKWISSFKYYDEIWTMSNFMTQSISKLSSIPVLTMPYPIKLAESQLIKNRKKFGISEDEFVFLLIFDFASIFERKNPLGVITAFSKAFDQNEKKIKLIIKSINGNRFPAELKMLEKAADSRNIILFNEHLGRDDVLSLLASSDCYVSLHKAEGLGLTIIEAMFAGKPVIATGYGGNIDVMNVNNSFLVKYKLVRLEKDHGPYNKGNFWAEPESEHAAMLMRYVYENQAIAREIGRNASEFIVKNSNLDAIGKEIKSRIERISKKS